MSSGVLVHSAASVHLDDHTSTSPKGLKSTGSRFGFFRRRDQNVAETAAPGRFGVHSGQRATTPPPASSTPPGAVDLHFGNDVRHQASSAIAEDMNIRPPPSSPAGFHAALANMSLDNEQAVKRPAAVPRPEHHSAASKDSTPEVTPPVVGPVVSRPRAEEKHPARQQSPLVKSPSQPPTIRRETGMVMNIITDDTFIRHEGFDLVHSAHIGFFQSYISTVRLKGDDTCHSLKSKISTQLDIPTDQFRLWMLAKRANGAMRPAALLPQDGLLRSLGYIKSGQARVGQQMFVFLEKSSIHPEVGYVMILVKEFDAYSQALFGRGHTYAPRSVSSSDLCALVRQLEDLPEGCEMSLYKENKRGDVSTYQQDGSECLQDLEDGDVICFQLVIPSKKAEAMAKVAFDLDAAPFYAFLDTRLIVLLHTDQSNVSGYVESFSSDYLDAPELRRVNRRLVEVKYVLRRLEHVPDISVAMPWFMAYLLASIYSKPGPDFKHAVTALKNGTADQMMTILQRTLDSIRAGNQEDPAAKKKLLADILRLTNRLSAKSGRPHPDLVVADVVIDNSITPLLGGFGTVYTGFMRNSNARVAVKRLKFDDFVPERLRKQMIQAFHQEALMWRQLDHRHILPFLGVIPDEREPCMVSPWMTHQTVRHYLLRCCPIQSNKREVMLAQIADAIDYLHGEGIVHGDIKGLNIFVNDEEQPQVADFGLAVVGETSKGLTTSNRTSDGTTPYMAPETFVEDSTSVPPRRTYKSDVYAFAGLCFEMFALKVPFEGVLLRSEIMGEVLLGTRPIRPPVEDCHGRDMPNEIWDLMWQCWDQKPEERPSSADVKATLSDFVQ